MGDTELEDECRRDRQRQEEFDRIDRAHDLARLRPLDQQVRRHHRAPAATPRRV